MPFVSALYGIAWGLYRLSDHDYSGAGMEVLSGIASTLPGYGTTASLGIDAVIIAKDVLPLLKEQGFID